MKSFLERYQAGDHVGVWDDLMALGEGVRHELYYADATAVAAETMRRARHNVELLIERLDARGYRFLDSVSSAEDRLSQLGFMEQLSSQIEGFAEQNGKSVNVHTNQMLEAMRSMKAQVEPVMEKVAKQAAEVAAAKRKPPLQDPQVFNPPDKTTARLLKQLEKAAGGPLPISLRAWYEEVGGVSLMGSDSLLNAVDFSGRNMIRQLSVQRPAAPPPEPDFAPDPLVMLPLEELLAQADGDEGGELQIVLAPDDLHKANVSGDAYYITLPNAHADFTFDDWHHTSFVNYLRITFQWGGFPGWERSRNAPREELKELSEGLLPL